MHQPKIKLVRGTEWGNLRPLKKVMMLTFCYIILTLSVIIGFLKKNSRLKKQVLHGRVIRLTTSITLENFYISSKLFLNHSFKLLKISENLIFPFHGIKLGKMRVDIHKNNIITKTWMRGSGILSHIWMNQLWWTNKTVFNRLKRKTIWFTKSTSDTIIIKSCARNKFIFLRSI